ncbi:MAG: helix-turn-helix domain-containing protein [Crocinitomix sp.]|nr:helix-turn-helix domain-containing protein [Crocinitomix sp.]
MKFLIDKYCSKEWKAFIDFHKKTKHFEKGEFVFEAGQDTKGLYIIESGKVKITSKQFDKSLRLIRLANDGDILGHRGFGGNWKYPISASTLEKTEVTFISVKVFDVIAKTNALFSYHLMMFFAEELRKSEAKIKHYPVKNLVARALLDNCRAFGFENKKSTKLAYTLSRKDLASKAGTTYETVVRSLAEFKKAGIIDTEGKAIHVLDLDRLRAIARPEELIHH